MRTYDGTTDRQRNKAAEGDLTEECKPESTESTNREDGVTSVCGNVFH